MLPTRSSEVSSLLGLSQDYSHEFIPSNIIRVTSVAFKSAMEEAHPFSDSIPQDKHVQYFLILEKGINEKSWWTDQFMIPTGVPTSVRSVYCQLGKDRRAYQDLPSHRLQISEPFLFLPFHQYS